MKKKYKDSGNQQATECPYLFWCFYEYEEIGYPLMFVPLKLDNEQVLDILKWFDCEYGNTAQETDVWAVEYQLLTRMLIHDNALLVNPLHLELGNIENELLEILGPDNIKDYLDARRITPEECKVLYSEYEPF